MAAVERVLLDTSDVTQLSNLAGKSASQTVGVTLEGPDQETLPAVQGR